MKLAVLVIAAILLVTPGLAATYKSPDGALSVSARVIDVNAKADTFVASGKAHVSFKDPVAKTSLVADAEKITVVIGSIKNAKSGKGVAGTSLRSATLEGPVTMVYTFTNSAGGVSKITGTADNADYDGESQIAHLNGHVKIVNDDPSLFAQPAVMTGDRAAVNLAPNPSPDGFRFRVESSPGMSTITVTPKPKAAQ